MEPLKGYKPLPFLNSFVKTNKEMGKLVVLFDGLPFPINLMIVVNVIKKFSLISIQFRIEKFSHFCITAIADIMRHISSNPTTYKDLASIEVQTGGSCVETDYFRASLLKCLHGVEFQLVESRSRKRNTISGMKLKFFGTTLKHEETFEKTLTALTTFGAFQMNDGKGIPRMGHLRKPEDSLQGFENIVKSRIEELSKLTLDTKSILEELVLKELITNDVADTIREALVEFKVECSFKPTQPEADPSEKYLRRVAASLTGILLSEKRVGILDHFLYNLEFEPSAGTSNEDNILKAIRFFFSKTTYPNHKEALEDILMSLDLRIPKKLYEPDQPPSKPRIMLEWLSGFFFRVANPFV